METVFRGITLAEELRSILDTQWFGSRILYFDTVDSTNDEIKRQAKDADGEGLLVIAECQTAGKGRRGRTWQSPAGSGIWMSFLLKPKTEPARVPAITLIAAMGALHAIKEKTGLDVLIKWPNDIVINGRKLVGILTEAGMESGKIAYAAVGVGINVNNGGLSEELSGRAASLEAECGHSVSRPEIIASFGKYFEKYYKIFTEDGDMRRLRADYEAFLVNKGAEVVVLDGAKKRRRALGINDGGELVVEDSDGNIEYICAGEVSVRGVYGYT